MNSYTEQFQLNMTQEQKKLLELYKEKNGVSYNFIVDRAITEFLTDSNNDIPKPYEIMQNRKRVVVRIKKETLFNLQKYCKEKNTKLSPTAVVATINYIQNKGW